MTGHTAAILFIVTALLNCGAAIINWRHSRRLSRLWRKHSDDVMGLAMFVAAVAHPDSPVPDAVRADARRALPSWIAIEFERGVAIVAPSSDRVQ